MAKSKLVVIDFETMPIEDRPRYPPEPVGVSIKHLGKKAKYYAWGHVSGGNNCTYNEGRAALAEVWDSHEIIFHNGRFDIDVATERMGMSPLPWARYHDTLILLYLDDPRRRQLDLKGAAQDVLGIQPTERDEMADWLIANQPVPGIRIVNSKKGANRPAKYTAFAPGDIAGKYANADTTMTEALFKHLHGPVAKEMNLSYKRERRLYPWLLRMERGGVPVDLESLRQDVPAYQELILRLEAWVNKALGTDALSLKGDAFAAALLDGGFADPSLMGVTKTGKVKTDKKAFADGVVDPQMAAVLRYHSALSTCVGTFLAKWLETAEETGGLIYTKWNATRTPEDTGASTGRFSSTPNFQNIPKEFLPLFKQQSKDGKDPETGKPLPPWPFKLPQLPLCRRYIKAAKGKVLIDRDYSQQELRVLAHVEGGALAEAYAKDPWMDVHDYTKTLVNTMLKTNFSRKPIKNTNFGIIYGMGVGKLAEKSAIQVDVAKKLKTAIMSLFPGLKELYDDCKQRAKANEPVWTWGGRRYYVEDPVWDEEKKRWQTFDYKLPNVIIQGSSADITKDAIIYYGEHGGFELAPLILQVHDELMSTTDDNPKSIRAAMKLMHEAMSSVKLDVPMFSEGDYGHIWSELKVYDTKGVIKYAG